MPGSLLISAIAVTLTYSLLRLRSFLVGCGKKPQPSSCAYVMWFTETDGYANGDDDIYEDARIDAILGLWPTETVEHAWHCSRDDSHEEDDVWASRERNDSSTFLLPEWSLVPAYRPDRCLIQTTYHCSTCGQHAWAQPPVLLLCGICKRPMQPLSSRFPF
jgi:hypothetical protein